MPELPRGERERGERRKPNTRLMKFQQSPYDNKGSLQIDKRTNGSEEDERRTNKNKRLKKWKQVKRVCSLGKPCLNSPRAK